MPRALCYKEVCEERAPERRGFCDSATDWAADALEAMLTQLMPPPEAFLLCSNSSPLSLGTPKPTVDSTSVRHTFTCCRRGASGGHQQWLKRKRV